MHNPDDELDDDQRAANDAFKHAVNVLNNSTIDDVDTVTALNDVLDDIDYQTTLVDLRNDFVDTLAKHYDGTVASPTWADVLASASTHAAALTNPPRHR